MRLYKPLRSGPNRRKPGSRMTRRETRALMALLILTGMAYAIGAGMVGWWGASSANRHMALIRTIILQLTLTSGLVLAIHRILLAHVVQPLRRLADYDELTGLLRAGAFWAEAEAAMAQSLREQQPVAFIFLDVDDFKQINDQYGHATGDAVLHALGTVLRQSARQGDRIGRLGGEEFGWLMIGVTPGEASKAAHRILTKCRNLAVEALPGFGLSGGIAVTMGVPTDPTSAWDLARGADQALYRAKAAGKGQVIWGGIESSREFS